MSPRAQPCSSWRSRRMFSPPAAGPSRCSERTSDVEAKVDDVAIANNVVATLQPLLSLLAHRLVRAGIEQLGNVDHLGADESGGEVGVDRRCCIQRRAPFTQRP